MKAMFSSSLAVLGWVITYITIAPWWAIATASEHAIGLVAHFASVVVSTAPTLLYFFVVGAIFGRLFGRPLGLKWALLSAAVAMCIYALAAQITFFGGIDPFAVLVVVIHFLLPLLVTVAGVMVARIWQGPASDAPAT